MIYSTDTTWIRLDQSFAPLDDLGFARAGRSDRLVYLSEKVLDCERHVVSLRVLFEMISSKSLA